MYLRRDSLGLENFESQFPSSCTDDSEVKYSSLMKEIALHQPLGLKTQSTCVREHSMVRKASQRKQRRRRSNALDLNFFQRCDTSGQNCMGASKTMCKSRSGVFVRSNSLGSLGLESEGVLQQPLGLKTHDGKCTEDKRAEQQLEEIWKQTVIQNHAAVLRNAITIARDAGHKVRFNSMTLLNYGEDSYRLDTSSVTNHGSAESCGLRAAIKRTLRKGLGEEYKDLLASAVRVLEKLEIQRALLQALSQWGRPGLSEVLDRANKACLQSPEFELAKALLERDRSSASPCISPTVSPCHIRAEEVACNFNLRDAVAPEATQDASTVTEPSAVPEISLTTPSHSTLADQRKFQKVVIKDAAEVDPAETEGSTLADNSPASAKLLSRPERQGTAGTLRRRAPPLASLVSQPWAGLDVGRLMEDGLHPRRAES